MAENVALPPGFVLDTQEATPAGLPAGFVLDAAPKRSALQSVGQNAAVASKAIVENLPGAVLAPLDLATYGYNKLKQGIDYVQEKTNFSGVPYVGAPDMEAPSTVYRRGINEISKVTPVLRNPENNAQELLAKAAGGAAAAFGGTGYGDILSAARNPVVAGTGDILRAAPGVQTVAGGSAGLSGELARQSGASPEAQMVAEVGGGLLGGGVAAALSPRSTPILSPTARAGSAEADLAIPQKAVSSAKAAAEAASERTPEYIRAVKTLESAKIPLTKGQRTGTNWIKSAERTLSDTPMGGKPLQKVFETQQKAYQRELLKRAGLDDGSDMITRETLEKVGTTLSGKYVKALGGKSVSISDDAFLNDLAAIEAKHTQFVDDPSKARVKQIVGSFLDASSKEGQVTGEWYQAQRSLFAKRSMKNSEVADLYGDLKTVLDDAFTRSAGKVKGNLDSQYARYKQLQSIFDRNGGPAVSEGFISPVAVAREAAGSPGGKDWQDFTRAAAAVLPDRLGNSGTAQRNFVLGIAGGSVPAALIEPTTALMALGGLGAARGTSSLLARQPATASPLFNPLPPSLSGILAEQTAR